MLLLLSRRLGRNRLREIFQPVARLCDSHLKEAASATRDGVIAGENNSARYVDVATRLNNQRQDKGVSVGCWLP
jgi:hypothetical protein